MGLFGVAKRATRAGRLSAWSRDPEGTRQCSRWDRALGRTPLRAGSGWVEPEPRPEGCDPPGSSSAKPRAVLEAWGWGPSGVPTASDTEEGGPVSLRARATCAASLDGPG